MIDQFSSDTNIDDIFVETLFFLQIRKTCHYYVESLSKINNPNYLFLRYEDMSRDQLSTAKHVYDFIGHPMTEKLLKWIDESSKTHGTGIGDYSTLRDSILTMTAWRHKISFSEVN